MKQMIDQAIIRFDNVPRGVESKMLKRVELPVHGDILEYEYIPRKGMSLDRFEMALQNDLNGPLGKELSDIGRTGLNPVLHLDFRSIPMKFLWVNIGYRDVRKLAKRNLGFEISTTVGNGDSRLLLSLSPDLIRMISAYGFSLEIA
jgi:hypothetical protein